MRPNKHHYTKYKKKVTRGLNTNMITHYNYGELKSISESQNQLIVMGFRTKQRLEFQHNGAKIIKHPVRGSSAHGLRGLQ